MFSLLFAVFLTSVYSFSYCFDMRYFSQWVFEKSLFTSMRQGGGCVHSTLPRSHLCDYRICCSCQFYDFITYNFNFCSSWMDQVHSFFVLNFRDRSWDLLLQLKVTYLCVMYLLSSSQGQHIFSCLCQTRFLFPPTSHSFYFSGNFVIGLLLLLLDF